MSRRELGVEGMAIDHEHHLALLNLAGRAMNTAGITSALCRALGASASIAEAEAQQAIAEASACSFAEAVLKAQPERERAHEPEPERREPEPAAEPKLNQV